ncbi:MAG: ankyrin repeat domain-containing protein [Mailhella sp.]|nr:ankyrin repeat domain-containing protein [Mailhella sp.]
MDVLCELRDECGPDPDNEDYFRAVDDLVESGCTDMLRRLVKAGMIPLELDYDEEGLGAELVYLAVVWFNDISFVKMLLEAGASPNYSHPNHERYPLLGSVGDMEMMRLLLEHGAVDSGGGGADTALLEAVHNGDDDVVRLLLEYLGAQYYCDGYTHSYIAEALKESHYHIAYLLWKAGFRKFTTASGDNVLAEAVLADDARLAVLLVGFGAGTEEAAEALGSKGGFVTELLGRPGLRGILLAQMALEEDDAKVLAALEAEYGVPTDAEAVAELADFLGVDMESENSDEWTPLHNAASNGKAEVVQFFLDRGADIEARNNDGSTPLHTAACYGHADVVKLLLDRGADIEARNNDGSTPLHTAYGQAEVVSLLLDRGADMKAKDEHGKTALHSAVESHWWVKVWETEEVVRLLLDRGADIEAKDLCGSTALHYAAADSRGRGNVVRLLLDRGADIEAKNNDGSTVLYNAADSRNKVKMVRLLLDRGADTEAKNNDGTTALCIAARHGNTRAVKRLLNMGADAQATDAAGKTAMGLAVEALLADKLKEANVKNLLKAGLPATAADAEALIAGLEAKDPKAAAKQRKGRSSLYNLMLAQA